MSASSPAALALLLLSSPASAALEKDARVRAAVAWRLGREPGRRPLPHLVKLLRQDESAEVRRAAAAALARSRAPEAARAREEDAGLRSLLDEALARLPPAR